MDTIRYGQLVDAKLRKELALKDGVIFNNRYEGNAVKGGIVKVRKSGTATIADYDTANGVIATTGASQYIDVLINKDKAVNEIIDGFDAASVTDDIVGDRIDTAGYGLASTLDEDGATELVTGGTAMTDTAALTKTNVYNCFVDARTAMSKVGVPVNGRYAIVSPDTFATVLKSSEFISASNLGDKVKETGALGAIAGFAIYESANLGEKTEVVFGHPGFAARIKEWSVPVHVQDINASGKYIGACAVQGRMVYGHKVTDANAILVKKTA